MQINRRKYLDKVTCGMITEDYASFETAKLLKEKGFDEYCKSAYHVGSVCSVASLGCHDNEGYGEIIEEKQNSDFGKYDNAISAPTLQMAMKWLREKYNKIIVPGISLGDRTSSTISHYIVGIWHIPENNGGAFCYTSPTPYGGYPSFEEACEAGIKYCIENLI